MKILLMVWRRQPWLHLVEKEEATVERVEVLIAPTARGWVTAKRIVIRCMAFLTRLHRFLG